MKLLLFSTGNITNAGLGTLIAASLLPIVEAFRTAAYVALSRTSVIVHV